MPPRLFLPPLEFCRGVRPSHAPNCGLLREHQSELAQQAPDAVDAGGALGLEAFAQAVHAQEALLIDGLDGNEMHVWAPSGLADGSGIVGVVLAGLTLQAVRSDEVGGDDAGVQAHGAQAACPVVSAGTGLHGEHATGGQLGAPGQEFVARKSATRNALTTAIDGVNLKNALG